MKNWLKKALTVLACAVMGVTASISLASCNFGGGSSSTGSVTNTSESVASESNALEHEHNYVETNVVDATCAEEGTKTLTCSCGDVKTEPIEKKAHTWVSNADAKYIVSEATCTEFAVYNKSCEVCGAKGTETFIGGDLQEHTWVEEATEEYLVREASCDLAASYAKHCSVCDNKGGEIFYVGDALGHQDVKTTIEPSCFTDGFDSYTCDRCGRTYADLDSVVKAPGEHTHTPTVTPPTCTTQGYTTYTCVCGDKYVADYVPVQHNYETTVVPSTCSEMGYTLHKCACGEEYKDTYQAVTAHSYTRVETTPATCTAEGVYTITFTCACDKVEYEPIPKKAHVYVAGTPVAPTCTEEGYTAYTCECGDFYKKDFTPATGHTYVEGQTVEATCTEKGYTEFVCVCGASYKVETAEKGHTITAEWILVVDDEGNEVLTHVDGCTYERTYNNECAECKEPLQKTEELTKHNYAMTITRIATCQEGGEKSFTCTCGSNYTEGYSVAWEEGHIWSMPQSSGGVETVYCTVGKCGEEKTTFKAEGTDVKVDKSVLENTNELQMEAATIKMDDATRNQLMGEELNLHASTLNEEDKALVMSKMSEEEQAKLADKPIFNFTINDGKTTNFDGEMTITVRYDLLPGEDAEAIYVWYLNADGLGEEMPATYTEIDGLGYAVFKTTHFSSYTIVRLTPSERCAKYGHDWKDRRVEATCETDGYYLMYCIRCGGNETVEVYNAFGHDYVENTVAPTCTAQGFTTHSCMREGCGKEYADNFVNALGHEYSSQEFAVTCTTPGYIEYTCGRCQNVYQDITEEALGHNYEMETIAPTCKVRGYDKYTCTVCGASYETNFVPKVDHEYEAETVASTCSAKGYTRYTCKHCGTYYDDRFTDKIGHTYEDSVVDPTCTAKGYDLHTCSACGYSYKDNYKNEVGHIYGADYKCEVCQADHPAVNHGSKGFYTTLMEGVLNASSYLVTLDGFTVSQIVKENGEPTHKTDGEIQILQLTFGFDEDGYLVGHGEVQLSMNEFDYEENYVEDGGGQLKAIFKDGKMYVFMNATYDGENEEMYVVMSQDYFISAGFPIIPLRAAYMKLYSDNARAIITTALGTTDKEVNDAIGAITEFFFVKSETGSGYTFTLNADQIYAALEKLSERSTKSIIEEFFGTGSFDKAFARIHEIMDMTVGELEAEIEARLVAAGYTIDDLYDLANYAFGMVFAERNHMDEVDIKSSIAEYKDDVIGEMMAEQMDADLTWLHSVIDKLQAMCEKRSIVSVLLEMSGRANSEAQAEDMIDELLGEVEKYLPYLGETEITLTTDKAGKASAMTFKLDINFESKMGMGSNESVGGGTIGGMASVIERVNTIVISGNGTIKFNDSYEMTFGDLPQEIDRLLSKVILKDAQVIPSYREGLNYIVYKKGDETFIGYKYETLPNIRNAQEVTNLGKETLGDVEYDKYSVMYGWISQENYYGEDYVYYIGANGGTMFDGGKCGDWKSYSLLSERAYAYYTVWALADGTVVRYELDTEAIKDNLRYSDGFYFWYNEVTGEMQEESPHNYALVNTTEEGEGCDKVVTKYYECLSCGAGYEAHERKDHNMESRYILVEGATSCEDGWIRQYACTNCDYVEAENYVEEGHQMMHTTIEIETECGIVELWIESCACGYYSYWDKWQNGDWQFGETDCNIEEYRGNVEFDEEGFPIAGKKALYCTTCGTIFEIEVENSENNEKKYSVKFAYVSKEESGDVGYIEDVTKPEGGYVENEKPGYGENEKPGYGENEKPGYGEGEKPGYGEGEMESCYSTGGCKIIVNGVVVFEQSYSVANHRYIDYSEDYVDGYRVMTESCQCGAIICVRKVTDDGQEVYYENDKGEGYRVEYEGCVATYTYFNKDGDYKTTTSESHGRNGYTTVVSLPWYASSCLHGIIMERFCADCGVSLGTQSGRPEEHYYGDPYMKEISTPCGTIYVEARECACGECAQFNDIMSEDCALEYFQTETEMGAECTKCGARVVASAEVTVDGCTQTMDITGGAYVNGNAVWEFAYTETYTSHNMDKVMETDEDGNRVDSYKCTTCGKVERSTTYDAQGRIIREVHEDGSGYYVEYDECTATWYYFDSKGNIEKGHTEETHSWGYSYEFMTSEKNCEAGVYVTYGCTVCGTTSETYESYWHDSRHQELFTTYAPCGEIRVYGENCACDYVGVMRKGLWVDYNGCNFNEEEEYNDWNDELGYTNRKVVYTCMECGYVYTMESYAERSGGCTVTYYLVYNFNGEEVVFSYAEARHNWRFEEGATDDGVYIREEYCEECGTWNYHYEEKYDEYGRKVYYMDRLAGEGWEKVYGANCTYTLYTLNQAGQRIDSTQGVEHAGYRVRYELLPGSTDCEDGVMYYYECASCGAVQSSYETYGHMTFMHKQSLTADCGYNYVEWYECACGKVVNNEFNIYGVCDMGYQYGNWEHDYDYDSLYGCWVTECGFHYTLAREYYYEDDSCLCTAEVTCRIYNGTILLFQKTGKSKYTEHRWDTQSYMEGDVQVHVQICLGCGLKIIDKYDRFGRWIYHWNGQDGQGWMKKFNVCEYTHIDFDITGNRWGYWTGIEHALPHHTYIKDSCTQYGTEIMYCSYCGVTEYDNYVEPSHKYEWNGETYVCWDCGLENEKGYDGNFIVEDLTADYDGYTVGFFNRLGEFWEMEDGYNFYIVLNYGMDNEVVTEGVLYDLVEYGYDKTGAAGSGIIMIDMDSLNAAIEKAYPNGGFANVSIVFQYFDRDYETGQHSYLDHVITLDRI